MTSKATDQNFEEQSARSGRSRETLGAQLRHAREARGLSLRDIAEETRISRRHLEAIEADDYSQLPGGIFTRSFIRAYARKVGVDENRALEDYVREVRERGGNVEETQLPTRPPVYTGETGKPSLVKFLLTLIVAALVAGGAYLLLQWSRRAKNAPAVANQTAQTAPANAATSPNTNAATTNQAANPNSSAGGGAQPNAMATNNLRIAIKARGEQLWIDTYTDGKQMTKILNPNETQEFTPERDFKVRFSKSRANVFDMTINGAPVKAAPTPKNGLLEFEVTKDNAAQLIK